MINKAINSPLKKRQFGFTLIEVMAALAVLAVGMTAAMHASNQASLAGSFLKQKTIAHWTAENLTTEVQIEKKWLSIGQSKDTVEMAGLEWVWTRKVTKTDVPELRRVDIRVFAEGSDIEEGEEKAHVVSFIQKP